MSRYPLLSTFTFRGEAQDEPECFLHGSAEGTERINRHARVTRIGLAQNLLLTSVTEFLGSAVSDDSCELLRKKTLARISLP